LNIAMPLFAGCLQWKKNQKSKSLCRAGRRGPMVGRFDKKIRDRWDDDNGSAELRSKIKIENKELLL